MISDILSEGITIAKQRIKRSETAHEKLASASKGSNQTPEASLNTFGCLLAQM